ncbi:MAG: hypothetical protein DHS80DRAFT_23086 [Piptocephalis tieghemiana]|nr:MAG: hypothetical protein DHS80DRAFT_23086 [Piptocephalis tieghemiana]
MTPSIVEGRRRRDFWLTPRHLRAYFILLVAGLSITLLFLHHSLQHTPYSAFHDQIHSHQVTNIRKQQTLAFLEESNRNQSLTLPQQKKEGRTAPIVDIIHHTPSPSSLPSSPLPAADPLPALCIGVSSVWRNLDQYVHQALGSLLRELTQEERSRIHLVAFLPDQNITSSLNHLHLWGLDTLVDAIAAYSPEDSAKIDQLTHQEDGWWRKAVIDSANIMNYCSRTQLPYALLLEDDALATEYWYPKVQEALKAIDADLRSHSWLPLANDHGIPEQGGGGEGPGQGKAPWLYLRLFTTEWLMGLSNEDIPCIVLIILTLIFLQIYLFLRLSRVGPMDSGILKRFLHSSWSKPSQALLLLLTLLLSSFLPLILSSIIGKQNLFPPPQGLTRRVLNRCCTPAILYPHSHLAPFAHSLSSVALHPAQMPAPVDILLEDYAEDLHLIRYTWTPSLWQHIGQFQSKKGVTSDRSFLYSVSFEQSPITSSS